MNMKKYADFKIDNPYELPVGSDCVTISHYLDIHHLGTQSSFASFAMLLRPNKAETSCPWLLAYEL